MTKVLPPINLFKANNGNTKTMCEILSNDVTDVILLSLLLILKRFHTLFKCFHCPLWTGKYRLGGCWLKIKFTHTKMISCVRKIVLNFVLAKLIWTTPKRWYVLTNVVPFWAVTVETFLMFLWNWRSFFKNNQNNLHFEDWIISCTMRSTIQYVRVYHDGFFLQK